MTIDVIPLTTDVIQLTTDVIQLTNDVTQLTTVDYWSDISTDITTEATHVYKWIALLMGVFGLLMFKYSQK